MTASIRRKIVRVKKTVALTSQHTRSIMQMKILRGTGIRYIDVQSGLQCVSIEVRKEEGKVGRFF